MSADVRLEDECAPTGKGPQAFYFGSGGNRLFGWLHSPYTEAEARVGLVICNPFGYEAICAHRSVRVLGEAAAALDVPALRFDYSGTGDSAEIEPEADQIEAWCSDTLTAIAELQRRTGVERICLLGFRIGGLVATLAAARCKAVSSLILIAPVVSGRRYLRELRTVRLAASLSSRAGGSFDDGGHPGAMEVSGFSLSAATLARLAQIDLTDHPAPTAETLLIDSSSFPVARAWSEAPSGAGIRYRALPGLIEMLMTDPQFAVTSQEVVAAMRAWLLQDLRKGATDNPDGRRLPDHPEADLSSASLALKGDSTSGSASLTERPVFFGTDAALFGIVTEPGDREMRRRAVIMLNAGADHHIGPSRMHVSLARRWARRGYFVLRMDLAGIGDSRTRRGRPDDDSFPPAALDDVRAGIEFMKARYGIRDVALTGLCSGAYHTLRAAVAGAQVTRILMVNPQNFFWKKGMTLNDLQVAEVVRNPGLYRQRVLSIAAWRRLFSGRVNIWRIVKIYMQRPLLTVESRFRDLTRRLGIRLSHDLGWELEELAARGVRIAFVFARGEPGIDLLKIEGGSSVGRLGPRCRVRIVEDADHIFSHSAPRTILEDMLSEELFVRTDWIAAKSAESRGTPSTV
jgi:pimeloyl-ACP methyl ester carboxylesterase